MKLISWIKDILTSKQNVQKLSLVKSGFEMNNRGSKTSIEWDEVEKIDAFKRDLLTEDQICLEVYTDKSQIYCSEDFDGWMAFKE